MNESAFDTFSRHAGSAQTRRTSLKALAAAAAVAAVSAPLAAEAGKAGKKAKKRCKKQGGPCRAFAAALCEDLLPPAEVEECIELFQPCCGLVSKCKGGPFFDCVGERLSQLLVP